MSAIESYKHKFAKETVAGWLREACVGNDRASLSPLGWRVNRRAPHFGVWTEYPVALDSGNRLRGLCPVWDETGWDEGKELWATRPPSYDEVLGLGLTPIVIFDIAIQHKGWIYAAVEIVHANGISEKKLDYLERIRAENGQLDVFVVDADWVLSRVKRPDTLKYTTV